MNQSNKEYIRLLIDSGVHTLLKDKPNNYFNLQGKVAKNPLNLHNKNLYEIDNIEELIYHISNHESVLKKTSKKITLFEGDINSNIMIIGGGSNKDDQEKPFAGNSGQLLDKMLLAINLKRENVYITNVLPFCTPENRRPTDAEILEFLPFLQKQIEIIKPLFILTLGTTATKAILTTPLGLEKLRGKWYKYQLINLNDSIDVLVSYHPTFLLQSTNYKKKAWSDLQMLQKKINEN